eukprot:1157375-Pelagomonas_calceolata.AAC.7
MAITLRENRRPSTSSRNTVHLTRRYKQRNSCRTGQKQNQHAGTANTLRAKSTCCPPRPGVPSQGGQGACGALDETLAQTRCPAGHSQSQGALLAGAGRPRGIPSALLAGPFQAHAYNRGEPCLQES